MSKLNKFYVGAKVRLNRDIPVLSGTFAKGHEFFVKSIDEYGPNLIDENGKHLLGMGRVLEAMELVEIVDSAQAITAAKLSAEDEAKMMADSLEKSTGLGIEVVKVIETLPTKVWLESDLFGGYSVMICHEGMNPFEFAHFNYDYAYTSNASIRSMAIKFAQEKLGAGANIEIRQRELMPSNLKAEDLRMQIEGLQYVLDCLTESESNSAP